MQGVLYQRPTPVAALVDWLHDNLDAGANANSNVVAILHPLRR